MAALGVHNAASHAWLQVTLVAFEPVLVAIGLGHTSPAAPLPVFSMSQKHLVTLH